MNFYFSTNDIKALDSYSFKEKHLIITLANNRLTAPEKLVLGILKLVLLIPPFWFVAQLDSWWMALPVLFLLFAYLVFIRPVNLSFAVRHLDKALIEYQGIKEAEAEAAKELEEED